LDVRTSAGEGGRTDGVADASKVIPHFEEGGLIWPDAGFAPGLDDGEGGLEGVEGVDCVLERWSLRCTGEKGMDEMGHTL
jgi:hypothetical protein